MDAPLLKFNITVSVPDEDGGDPQITTFTDFFESSMQAVDEVMECFPVGSKIEVVKAE